MITIYFILLLITYTLVGYRRHFVGYNRNDAAPQVIFDIFSGILWWIALPFIIGEYFAARKEQPHE